MRKDQHLWGQAAMASSIRDRIHRLPAQKITLTHLPAQICSPHFWVLSPTDPAVVRPHGPRYEILSNAETWLAAPTRLRRRASSRRTTRVDTERGRLVIHYGSDLDVLQGVLERLGCDEG